MIDKLASSDFLTAPRVFVRVYRLPAPSQLTDGYCFQGAKPIQFYNVDWFEAIVTNDRTELVQFIRNKPYFNRASGTWCSAIILSLRSRSTLTTSRSYEDD